MVKSNLLVCYCEDCKYNEDRDCRYNGILEIDYERGYITNEYNPVCQWLALL